MILSVLFYSFVVFTVIQIIYYLFFTSFLFEDKNQASQIKQPPISVVICAKNEAKNLTRFLPFVINQNYPDFEIVLINDASSDETLDVMKDFKKKHPFIKIINVENVESFWGNKKYALTLGIKATKHEHLLFTDADCKPVSKHWISEMSKLFTAKKTIAIGYGKYKRKKGLVNLLVRFETLITAIQYFSYAKLGNPYMAVGRNLAYQKSVFYKAKGFINHIRIKSGDDDLFIQDTANKKNTTISTKEDSFTESLAPSSLKKWFQQKRRHISTAKHYKVKHQILLGLFFVSKVFTLFLAILLFFFYPWQIVISILLIYYTVQYIVVGFSAKKLKETQILWYLPFLEVSLILFQFSIFITNLISKPKHWK